MFRSRLNELLRQLKGGLLLVDGKNGIGKTSLVEKVVYSSPNVSTIWFDLSTFLQEIPRYNQEKILTGAITKSIGTNWNSKTKHRIIVFDHLPENRKWLRYASKMADFYNFQCVAIGDFPSTNDFPSKLPLFFEKFCIENLNFFAINKISQHCNYQIGESTTDQPVFMELLMRNQSVRGTSSISRLVWEILNKMEPNMRRNFLQLLIFPPKFAIDIDILKAIWKNSMAQQMIDENLVPTGLVHCVGSGGRKIQISSNEIHRAMYTYCEQKYGQKLFKMTIKHLISYGLCDHSRFSTLRTLSYYWPSFNLAKYFLKHFPGLSTTSVDNAQKKFDEPLAILVDNLLKEKTMNPFKREILKKLMSMEGFNLSSCVSLGLYDLVLFKLKQNHGNEREKAGALSEAVKEEDVAMVNILLSNGVVPSSTVETVFNSRIPVLIDAIRIQNVELVKLLTNETSVNYRDTSNETFPLMEAVRTNNLEIVDFLLCNGANVNMKNRKGENVLIISCCCSKLLNVFQRLCEESSLEIDNQDHGGVSALIRASERGLQSNAVQLLSKGANPNLTANNKSTALSSSLAKKFNRIAAILLEAGADCRNDPRNAQETLTSVLANNNFEALPLLFRYGVDINAVVDGESLLVKACKSSRYSPRFVEQLLKINIDANLLDKTGASALFYCYEQCMTDQTEWTLEKLMLVMNFSIPERFHERQRRQVGEEFFMLSKQVTSLQKLAMVQVRNNLSVLNTNFVEYSLDHFLKNNNLDLPILLKKTVKLGLPE